MQCSQRRINKDLQHDETFVISEMRHLTQNINFGINSEFEVQLCLLLSSW